MGSKKCILLAEDQADQREMIKLLLEGSGYKVTTAADGMRALQHLKKRNFDLVILDIMMPKVDGVRICDKLKHVRGRMCTPVLIISALAECNQSREKEWCERTLADAFLAKPFDTRRLLAVVADLTKQPISEDVAREKLDRQARLRDVQDLIEPKEITARAQLLATEQQISTQFYRPKRTKGGKS